jgi:hypothetical protein
MYCIITTIGPMTADDFTYFIRSGYEHELNEFFGM